MRTRASDSVLQVKDVNLKIKDKEILQNLRYSAQSGDLLAILGPTGKFYTLRKHAHAIYSDFSWQ